MTYDYVKRTYGVDPVVGERVRHHTRRAGKEGVIARERSPNHYVHVLFDGEKHALPCHPTEMDYLGSGDEHRTRSADKGGANV